MNTGAYFEIGNTHEVCQDYAIAGKINDKISYAIVSDGCSSSTEVDVGARLIAHCTKDFILTFFKDKTSLPTDEESVTKINSGIGSSVIHSAVSMARNLRINPHGLDATLVLLLTDKDHSIGFIFGDGGIITKDSDGKISYYSVHFESGAPYYMSYMLDGERQQAYDDTYGVKEDGKERFQVEVTKEVMAAEGEDPPLTTTRDIQDFDKDNILKRCTFILDTVDVMAVVSDGVDSYSEGVNFFETPQIESYSVGHLPPVTNFTKYKSFTGDFVFRRMSRFKATCVQKEITHYDDISIATIYTK